MTYYDPIKPWFLAAEETGEDIGIRYGRIAPGKQMPDWTCLKHTDVDGIGGFATLLRERGAQLLNLPQNRTSARPSRLAVVRTLPGFLGPRRRIKWELQEAMQTQSGMRPIRAIAWHVFDENSTTRIRMRSREIGVTVNSYLLKTLTNAIRPHLAVRSSRVPWMVPVNLRGKVARMTDIENHSSYVSVKIGGDDTPEDVHRNIYAALSRGDHWANWYAYSTSRLLTAGMRRFLIRTEKYMSQWHIGAFSNLGEWDADKRITAPDCDGSWLFCPPVLRCQHLGVGCVTFQNRLSLMIQVHPDLTVNSSTPSSWMQNWIQEISAA